MCWWQIAEDSSRGVVESTPQLVRAVLMAGGGAYTILVSFSWLIVELSMQTDSTEVISYIICSNYLLLLSYLCIMIKTSAAVLQ